MPQTESSLEAAKRHSKKNLTAAFQGADPWLWDISQGLFFVAGALQEMQKRFGAFETALACDDEALPPPKPGMRSPLLRRPP
jgi:hypothetical protein